MIKVKKKTEIFFSSNALFDEIRLGLQAWALRAEGNKNKQSKECVSWISVDPEGGVISHYVAACQHPVDSAYSKKDSTLLPQFNLKFKQSPGL